MDVYRDIEKDKDKDKKIKNRYIKKYKDK